MNGHLTSIGSYNLGRFARFEYFRCDTCHTDYPMIEGLIKCNGKSIVTCPYCHRDECPRCGTEIALGFYCTKCGHVPPRK